MLLNNLDVCPFIVKKSIAEIAFKENSCINRTTPFNFPSSLYGLGD